MNLILTNVVEERQINTDDYKCRKKDGDEDEDQKRDKQMTTKTMTVQRHLTQAMIPGSRIVKLEIEQSIHDRATVMTAVGTAPS
jgi:small nuclear ribonucleoprotein (snRNP)-like protein